MAHDPLLSGRRDADPRLRHSGAGIDQSAGLHGVQSQDQSTGSAGLELALYRFVRWLMNRRSR
jgi:hypothetical protein